MESILAALAQQLTDATHAMEQAGAAMVEADKVIRYQREQIAELHEANDLLDARLATLAAELDLVRANG